LRRISHLRLPGMVKIDHFGRNSTVASNLRR
jgi:hypothetical protein